nr:topoisomerase DNA-binding C4 zinc finger domain-containing protein [Blastocatellia bacterium]
PLGTTVNDLLIEGFGDIFNTAYTARLEGSLDEIEDGALDWRVALHGFYDKFAKDLETASESIKNKKKTSIPTDEICEKCGAGMVIKFGRFGQFLACATYPECKNTREVAKKKDTESGAEGESTETEEIPVCEHCGKDMVLKKGRFGAFYGCTGYPECKNIRKVAKGDQKPTAPPVPLDEICPKDGVHLVRRQGRFGEFISCSNYPKCDYVKRETLGIACSKCGGDLAVKKSKRGKVFYGCVNYPKCDEVYWDKPIDQSCPQCSAPYLLEKTTKKDGTVRYCKNEECDYKIPVAASEASSSNATEPAIPVA